MPTITTFDNTADGWERSRCAFLAEKERRSGSRRTVVGYCRMLHHFFGTVGKPPDRVTSARSSPGVRRRALRQQPSSVMIGARLVCLRSFCRFLIRMHIVSSNPCDALERPRVQVGTSRGIRDINPGRLSRRALFVQASWRCGTYDRPGVLKNLGKALSNAHR